MKVLLALFILIVLYQVPYIRVPLKWIVGLVLLGLLVKYPTKIADDIKKTYS